MEPNPKVKIISDSTCDLSQELTAKYDIDILPLHILLGENEFRDGKDITPERIFAWADANKATPKTSAPSLEDAKALLQPYVEAGREVICFSISGSMSTSGNVMRLAAEELDAAAQVTIIDSENLSTGIGLLVVEAAIMAEQGHSAAEITAAVRELIPKVRASFVVDTLVYLWRGGRCNAVAALAGSALRLHPKIVVGNGAMHATKKYRGKIDNAIMSYVKDMEADLKAARPERVFITHSGCSREVVEDFFAGDGLNETQLQKVYDYLTIQGIHTDEEKKKAEKVSEPEMPKKSSMFSYEAEEAEEEKKPAELTQEEKEYLEDYLETLNVILPEEEGERERLFELAKAGEAQAKSRLTELYMKEVLKIAKELHDGEVFLGDMVSEGNIGLIGALESLEEAEDISSFLSGEIRNAILLLLEEQTDQKQSDDILVEKVRNLEHKIKEIMDDDDDKYSAEELSAFLDMDLEEIQGILRLTGEDS